MRSNYIQPFSYDLGFLQPKLHPKIQSLFTKELMNLTGKTTKFTSNFVHIQKKKIFLDKAYQQQHNILISAEDLCAVSSDGVKYLKNSLVDFRMMKIVIIFRDSLSRTLSNYRQLYSQDKFLQKIVRQPDFKTYVNNLIVTKNLEKYYHTIIERYCDKFGYENIILIDYDGKERFIILLYELNNIPCDDLIQAIHPMINNINNANSAERHASLLFSGVISNIYLKKM